MYRLQLGITCGDELLVSYLRPANQDGFRHSWPILGLLIKRIKQAFPDVKITVRADSGFMRHKFIGWLEQKGIKYIVGMAQNKRLLKKVENEIEIVKDLYEENQETTAKYKTFNYKADSWKRERKIICKIEKNYHGSNIRFIVTNIDDNPKRTLSQHLLPKRGYGKQNKICST